MPRGEVRAGRAYVELLVKDNKLIKGLDAAGQRLRSWGTSVATSGARVLAVGAAIVTPLVAMANQFAAVGDEVNKMAARTGIGTEALSEIGFAAEQSGSDLKTFEKGVATMQRTLLDASRGSKNAVDSLGDIGLAVKDLQGLAPEEQFKTIAAQIAKVEDPSKRAALAMQIFGKSGQKLLPLLLSDIEALQKEAKNLGLSINTDEAQSAADLTDAWNRAKRTLKAVGIVIGSVVAPAITTIANIVAQGVVRVIGWIKANKELVLTALKIGVVVLAAGAAFVAIGGMLFVAGVAASGFAAAIGFVGSVIAAILSPLGLAIAAVIGLGVVLVKYTDLGGKALEWLLDRFGWLKTAAIKTWKAIANAMASGDLALAGEVAMATLRAVFQAGWHQVTKIFTNTWTALENTWHKTIDFFADTWSLFANGMLATWHKTIGFIQKAWVRLKALFDADINVDAEVAAINDKVSDKIDANQRSSLANKSKRDRDRNAEIANREAAAAERIRKSEEAVAKARDEWQKSIAKAGVGDGETGRPGGGPKVGDINYQIEAGKIEAGGQAFNNATRNSTEAKGGFNAFGVAGLGADSLADQQKKSTDEIAENTAQLVRQAKQGRLVFTQ